MLQQERHERILSKLNIEGRVVVSELSKEFDVTPDCIRKDLRLLEQQSLLKRIHGGAILERSNPHMIQAKDRTTLRLEEKQMIALKALSYIEPGDMIFLDISTISIELAKLIIENKLQVTIITNMIDIMNMMTQEYAPETILIGGQFNRSKDGIVGSIANSQIEKYQCDKAFLGTVGVDKDKDRVYTYDITDGLTKETILSHAKQAYLLCEKVKYTMDGNYVYASIEDFKDIITEES